MNRVARLLLVSESFWVFGSGLFFPIFAIFSEQVGGDIVDAGMAAAVFILVTSLLEYPVGKLLDRYHEKWFIVGDYFLEACIFVGYMFVTNMYELLLLQILLGVANAIGDPAWESLYGRSTEKKYSGSAWANSHFVVGVVNAVGIMIGVYLVRDHGFDVVFGLGAIFSLTAGIIATRYLTFPKK